MGVSTVVRRKVDQSRVSLSAFPMLNVLAATHARETASRLRSLYNTLADVQTEATAIVRCGRYISALPTPSVLGVIEIGGVPDAAAFHIDAELVSHIVDLSLGGDPGAAQSFVDRMPTMIDLAMCQRFADAVLETFEDAVRAVCKGKELGRLRCTRIETTPQMAAIAPERSEVLIMNQRAQIGDAPRSGFFELVLPLSVIDPIKRDLMRNFGSSSKLNADLWERHLRQGLMGSRLSLTAVVDVQKLPLSKVAGLKIGDVLTLSRGLSDEVDLVMATREGELSIAPCRLGAQGRMKAVKLLDDPRDDVLRLLRVAS